MAAPTHVKAVGEWKNVSLDPRRVSNTMMTGFVSMQELTDYEIITGLPSKAKKKGKSPEKQDASPVNQKAGKKKTKKKLTNSPCRQVSPSSQDDDNIKQKQNKSKGNKKKRPGENVKVPSIETQKPKRLKTQSPERNDEAGDDDNEQGKKKEVKQQKKGRMVKNAQIVDVYASNDATEEAEPNNKKENSRKRKSKDKPSGSPKKKQKSNNGSTKKKLKSNEKIEADGPKESVEDMSAWKNLFVPEEVLTGLSEQGFAAPTPIQTLVLPSAIRDRMDIIGAAETGSGKTLAFGIPLLHHIIEFKKNPGKWNSITDGLEETETNDDQGSEEDEISFNEGEGEEESEGEEEGEAMVIDMPAIAMESESEDDEERDLSPDEEAEDFENLEDGETGCVRVVNNVTFDWMEEATGEQPDADDTPPLLGLILTPTRELAIQVSNHLKAASKYTGIQIVVVVGGMAAQKQERLLRRCPEIVVATPGRLWEMIQEGDPHLSKVEDIRYLIIDEADRMVEKGHFEELSRLLEMINANDEKRKRRQNFVFSATLSMVHSGPNRYIKKKKREKVTSKQKLDSIMERIGISEKPKVIDLTKKEGTAETLTEARIMCTTEEKDMYLYYFLRRYPARTIVFCNSKDGVRRLVTVCTLLQCNPLPLHADMHQKQRLKNLDKFKSNPHGVLLATDVAARGLDIPNVQHVIHYQVPKTSENYVHRSGRTARALKEGLSVMLIGPEDQLFYKRIVKTLNRDEHLPLFPVESDYLMGIKPRVALARQIDKQEHRIVKQKVQNSWFERAALEMDIELDESQLHSLGSDREQSENKRKLDMWKLELKHMLRSPILSRQFSGKYPTKSGKLQLPYNTERLPSGAVDAIKGDQVKAQRKQSLQKKKTKRFWKKSK